MLSMMVKYLWVTIDYKPQVLELHDLAGPLEERPTKVLIPIPPIKTQMVGEALDLGIIELNTMDKKSINVTMSFSQMLLYEFYAI